MKSIVSIRMLFNAIQCYSMASLVRCLNFELQILHFRLCSPKLLHFEMEPFRHKAANAIYQAVSNQLRSINLVLLTIWFFYSFDSSLDLVLLFIWFSCRFAPVKRLPVAGLRLIGNRNILVFNPPDAEASTRARHWSQWNPQCGWSRFLIN